MYEEMLADEIEKTKEFYSRLNKTEGYQTPEKAAESFGITGNEAVKNAAEALLRYQGDRVTETVVEVENGDDVAEPDQDLDDPEEIAQNLFERQDQAQLNISARTADTPYVISAEEYLQNDPEFEQLEMTWYAGDNILCDDKDKPVENINLYVGDDNLQKFGLASQNISLVFVRNERLRMDFEVSYSDGTYKHEVMGLSHSDGGFVPNRRVRRSADE